MTDAQKVAFFQARFARILEIVQSGCFAVLGATLYEVALNDGAWKDVYAVWIGGALFLLAVIIAVSPYAGDL